MVSSLLGVVLHPARLVAQGLSIRKFVGLSSWVRDDRATLHPLQAAASWLVLGGPEGIAFIPWRRWFAAIG